MVIFASGYFITPSFSLSACIVFRIILYRWRENTRGVYEFENIRCSRIDSISISLSFPFQSNWCNYAAITLQSICMAVPSKILTWIRDPLNACEFTTHGSHTFVAEDNASSLDASCGHVVRLRNSMCHKQRFVNLREKDDRHSKATMNHDPIGMLIGHNTDEFTIQPRLSVNPGVRLCICPRV